MTVASASSTRDLLPIELVEIPERPADAMSGTAFARSIAELPVEDRWAAGVRELLRGNVPYAERTFWPVRIEEGGHRIVFWVSPEYLEVGSDDDPLPFPLDLPSAAKVALAWHCGLPTPRMVTAIHDQAHYRVDPRPLPPDVLMDSMEYLLRHRELVWSALGKLPEPGILSGDKKDVVLTPQLIDRPGKEAIFGWYRSDGEPIQPLSLWHRSRYADYSHGIRLVFGEVIVDGKPMELWDALSHPVVGPILSDEGPIPDAEGILSAAIRHVEEAAAMSGVSGSGTPR